MMTMRFALLLLLLFPFASHAQWQSCSKIGVQNGFNPGQHVAPRPGEVCPVSYAKPLFTREGTVACDSEHDLDAAGNAMNHGWRFVPTAGDPYAPKITPATGAPVTAAYYRCTVLHDGQRFQVIGQGSGTLQTSLGWIGMTYARN